MPRSVHELAEEMKKLQDEMEDALEGIRDKAQFTIENRRVIFEEKLRTFHISQRRSALLQIIRARFLVLITVPVIYSVVIPFALLDLFVSIYQTICFPVYRIPKVARRDYLIFDRRYLAYLNWIEKLNCAYCSYATGVIAYSQEVTSRTEQYWCPIKHARRIYDTHKRYVNFLEYGDAEAYRDTRLRIREDLRNEGDETTGSA
jgi:hypothetical protein